MPMISVRSLALPVLALAVIIALSQAHNQAGLQSADAAPTVYRAVNCSAPAKSLDASCIVAGSETTIVR